MFQVCDLIRLNFCLSLGQSHTHEGLVYNVKQFVLNYFDCDEQNLTMR